MNPREPARKVFEAQAMAMRDMKDPIAPIEKAIWDARQKALAEAMAVCLRIQGKGLTQEIQDYNAGCEDCHRAIEALKRVTF